MKTFRDRPSLQTQEIIAHVLQHCDRSQWIQTYALISKQWREAVLDRWWRSVNDVFSLFKLLGRLDYFLGTQQKLMFETHLRPSDWIRASEYFRRVREVSYDERTCKELNEEVWQELFITRPRDANWLPNLRSLKWLVHSDNALRKFMLFIHCPIRHLTVRLPAVLSPCQWKVFCEDIQTYKPELTMLDLRIHVVEPESVEAVAHLFSCLQHLQAVAFPPSHISAAALIGLCTKSDLRIITAYSQNTEEEEDDDDESKIPIRGDALGEEALSLPQNSFAKVEKVAIQLPLAILYDSVFVPTAFASLQKLYVQTPELEEPADIRTFNSVVAENVPRLRDLSLDISDRFMPVSERSQADGIGVWVFEPLATLNLEVFAFYGDCRLDIDNNDVLKFAHAWPNIRKLHLNPSFLATVKIPPSKITLALFQHLTCLCPSIRELGLCIDATSAKETSIIGEPFTSLRRLDIGLSDPGDPMATAVFLCELFSGCETRPALGYGAEWLETGDNGVEMQVDDKGSPIQDNLYNDLTLRMSQWKHIDENLLPAMFYYTSKLWGHNFPNSLLRRSSTTPLIGKQLHINGTLNGKRHAH